MISLSFSLLFSCNSDYKIIQPVDVPPEEITECGFTPVEGLPQLSSYDCNPVFTSTGEDWAHHLGPTSFHVTEVMGHPFYQIWYVGYNEDYSRWNVGHAASPDGIEWTTHPDNPSWPERNTTDWDAGKIQGLSISWDDNLNGYTMLYGGISQDMSFFGIGAAGSSDGHNWELSDQNPFLTLSLPYNGVSYAWPLTLDIKSNTYYAYFGGSTDDGPIDVYRLKSSKADSWNVSPSKVFESGVSDSWDDEGILAASVVEYDDTQYMFYIANAAWVDAPDGSYRTAVQTKLGLATSSDDGRSFQRAYDTPLPVHLTETGDLQMIGAQLVGSRVHLWVTDYYAELESNAIGYFVYELEE